MNGKGQENESESDSGSGKTTYWIFWLPECRKIKYRQCGDRTKSGCSLRRKRTTTDPVIKAMELLPAGPVVMIDTPGIDDDGELGKLRVKKSYQMLNRTDLAIVVIDGGTGIKKEDIALLKEIKKRKVPFIIAVNKSDLLKEHRIQPKGSKKVAGRESDICKCGDRRRNL